MKTRFVGIGAVTLAAAVLVAGCITTATYVVTAKLIPNPSPVRITDHSYSEAELEVDLSTDHDFRENQDKIKNIESIGFYVQVKNNRPAAVSFQLFLEEDTAKNWPTGAIAADSATELVFTGLVLPGSSSVTVDWNASMAYITSLDAIKKILERGRFSLYPVAIPRDDFDVTIDSLVVIVTISGG